MRAEILKKVLIKATAETHCILNSVTIDELARYLGEKLEQEDHLREKLSSIFLQKKALERQIDALEKERAELVETCAHLSGTDPISSADGELIEYICEICGSEVDLIP